MPPAGARWMLRMAQPRFDQGMRRAAVHALQRPRVAVVDEMLESFGQLLVGLNLAAFKSHDEAQLVEGLAFGGHGHTLLSNRVKAPGVAGPVGPATPETFKAPALW